MTPFRWWGCKRPRQVPDHDILLGVVAKRQRRVYPVKISPPTPAALDVSGHLQVGDYILGRPFSYPYLVGDFPGRATRVIEDVAEDQPVVSDEGPPSDWGRH